MKCPCGCGKEVPNGCFYANKEECWNRARRLKIHMPSGGECRSHERLMKKLNKTRKAMKNGRRV